MIPNPPYTGPSQPGPLVARLAIVGALALCVACSPAAETPSQETPSQETPSHETAPKEGGTTTDGASSLRNPAAFAVQGIDVSHFQDTVDWDAVAATGVTFAIVKATEGIDYVDPQFNANWSALGEQQMIRGAYHFYIAHDDPKTQADFFLSTVSFAKGDLIPIVDLERRGDASVEDTLAGLQVWLDAVEEALGKKPILYTDINFWNSLASAAFGDYPLWLAEYSTTDLALPKGWKRWSLWQYSEKGQVDGVHGEVDLDAFAGSREQLIGELTFASQPPAPGQPTAPPTTKKGGPEGPP